MRADNSTFRDANVSPAKEPRYVVELSFMPDNSVLWYFTSHTDASSPTPANTIYNVVKGISGTSQTINPDQALSTIGNISFDLVDKSNAITNQLGTQLTLGRGTRSQRVRVYVGYQGQAWANYTLIQTQLVFEITYKDGLYSIKCADIQRAMRKDIFVAATTTLAADVLSTDTTITVTNTAAFSMVAHGAAYSDSPSSTVGYFLLEKEVIRYTGKTSTTFTGCTRGVLNTLAADHKLQTTSTADRQTKVTEYVYLEMPAAKLIYALLTGVLNGQSANLPTSWHLGIDPAYVRLSDFTAIGKDLWDTSTDDAGFVVRFDGIDKTDGKAFIEKELNLLLGTFMPIYSDGALGLKRMAAVLAGSSYVAKLDETNVVSYGDLLHDFKWMHNQIQIDWNYVPDQKKTTRTSLLIDADSYAINGKSDVYKVTFRGLNGNRHSNNILESRFSAFRDRYTGPPLRITVQVLPSLNTLEVGDVVRLKLANVRDFITNGSLDRSFEVQNVGVDWITGNVSLNLFASSRAAAPPKTISGTAALNNSYYTAVGTALSTVLTITGSNPGHVTVNGTLTGTADANAAASIFYYSGDLVIDSGVTVTLNNNVQLRVMGVLTINGKIDGKGHGYSGATSPGAILGAYNSGTSGFIGTTTSQGSIDIAAGYQYSLDSGRDPAYLMYSHQGYNVIGVYPSVPHLELNNSSGTSLLGIPSELRGSSGSSGGVTGVLLTYAAGGAGGAGGAGLCVVCRGASFGVSGSIDLSGTDGSAGGSISLSSSSTVYSGSGAGGSPGACLFLLDGDSALEPSLSPYVVGKFGKTPIIGNVLASPAMTWEQVGANYPLATSYYYGSGDADAPDMSGARGACRIQHVPSYQTAEQDPDALVLKSPTAFGLESGTNALFVNGDGTVVSRIKTTWTPAVDSRVRGYDIQFKLSTDTLWPSAVTIFNQSSALTYLSPVKDGSSFDVRIRSVGDLRQVSAWVTITGHIVVGKTQPPSDITGFSVTQNGNVVVFQWTAVTDADYSGAEIRYNKSGITLWDSGTPITRVTKGTQITTAAVPPGSWTFLIKAVDTTGNYSTNATRYDRTITTDFNVIQQTEQSPSWLGTISSVGDAILAEDGSYILNEDGGKIMQETATDTFVRHWTGVLIPNSTLLASAHTNAQLFTQYVPFPQPTCIYESPEFDLAFDGPARVWGDIQSTLGPGVTTGIANPGLQIDYHLAAGAYAGYQNWTLGTVTARYIKHRINYVSSSGTIKITGFLPTADAQERTDTTSNITVGATGTLVTFSQPFHVIPSVSAFNTGTAALIATATGTTTTSTTIHLFNTSGTEVGGTGRIEAVGV